MPKITDPDLLNQGVEVQFLTGSQTGSSSYNLIRLNVAGALSASEGVGMQALYSFIKEEWRTDNNLIKFPIPMLAITSEQFEVQRGWDLSGSFSKYLIRDAGWALKDPNLSGESIEEWMNITTLGSFVTGSDQAYFLQLTGSGDTPENIQLSGEVNQGILIYASASEEYSDRDYRGLGEFKIFLRERGKTYDSYDLLQEQNLTALTYRKYALPLSNAADTKITTTTDDIFTGSDPYQNMTIQYFTESFTREIGGETYPFKVLITNANEGTAEQIYEFVQYKLRQTTDIDNGDNLTEDIRGDIADQLLVFVGDNLITQQVTFGDGGAYTGGVYIDGFIASDTNRITFTDDSGSAQNFPFVAAGALLFDTNLTSDPSSSYFVFFTNDDDGDNTGRDFGTDQAILIQDNSAQDITGLVNASSSISFDYDYDGNIQRGSDSSGSVVPYTAVALGLNTAQYVLTTGNITRTVTNNINFVAALERNYLNE